MNSMTPSSAKPKVLVVEDDAAVAQTLVTLLEAEGYPVCEARSSSEALEHLAAADFPIVISDIYLDERSGLAELLAVDGADGVGGVAERLPAEGEGPLARPMLIGEDGAHAFHDGF